MLKTYNAMQSDDDWEIDDQIWDSLIFLKYY